jgi:hypothetical protein
MKFKVLIGIGYLFFISADPGERYVNDNSCGITGPNSETTTTHTSYGEWPFVAALYQLIDDRIFYICGGTIISNFCVITGC